MLGAVLGWSLALGMLVPAASAEDAPPSGFPTWAEVEAAKGSADATRAQVERITGLLRSVETAAAEASQAAVGAAAAHAKAEQAVREQQAIVEPLAREREQRVGEREAGRRAAGRIASTAYKGGSTAGALDALAVLGDPDGLSRLGTLEILGNRAAHTLAAYHAAANTASAAEGQSRAAEEELSRLSAEASERLAAAQSAQRNAQDAVARTEGQAATLRAQLAELDATAAAVEAGHREGQDALAAYAAVQEAKRRAAEEAAARAAAEAQTGSAAPPAHGTPGAAGAGPAPGAPAQAPPVQAPEPNVPAPQEPAPAPTPPPVPAPPPLPPPAASPGVGGVVNDPAGAKAYAAAQLPAYGWGGGEYACLVSLWTRESKWLTDATNPYSGAYGIPQALPPSKYATAGPDWLTNYRTQITWGLGYIRSRYGSPCAAWAHSESRGWY
nr:lytic transglycosylase domain-containing protein [Sinomonas mesophila]